MTEENKDNPQGGSSASSTPQVPSVDPDLKKKVDDFDKFRGETTEFINGASVVIDVLANSPELRTAFQNEFKKRNGLVDEGGKPSEQPKEEPKKETPNDNSNPENDKLVKRVDTIEKTSREEIIEKFEQEHGIAGLSKEEQVKERRALESFLNEFGLSVKTSPLPNLRGHLEKAFLNTHAEKLREEGKLEGFAQGYTNKQGIMGNMSGGVPDSTAQKGFNEKQKTWMKKLGVSEEKAKKVWEGREEEQTRVPDSEKSK